MTPPVLARLGPIAQLAYVPRDFDAALQTWITQYGVGPFHLWEHIAVDRMWTDGRPASPDFSVALAYWGDVQIELIRQHNDAPSIYRDWNSDALHHILIAAEDYDAALKACETAGFPVAMAGEGLLGSPDFRFCYCALGANGPAGYVEFAARPAGGGAFAERTIAMKAASVDWDGRDPIRAMF
jgi:methylmalonyl-CoA/ethylmalonyl-CoA epimerase